MQIKHLSFHNLRDLSIEIPPNRSFGIAGVSGSGKTSFCEAVSHEAIRRIITLLPRSEYFFLFPDLVSARPGCMELRDLPLVNFLGKNVADSNPRSTIGTHSRIYNEVRKNFAKKYDMASQSFSFNHNLMWCQKCKGRGTFNGRICKACNGSRYDQQIHRYTVHISGNDYSIVDINECNIEHFLNITGDSDFISHSSRNVLQNLVSLDAGYLSLGRTLGTLSGGEVTRLYISEFINDSCGTLIIVDEISHGLNDEMIDLTIEQLCKLGDKNQLWLIDHSERVLQSTEKKLFFGPDSGRNGGRIVETLDISPPVSLLPDPGIASNFFKLKNLSCRNINLQELVFPQRTLISVTGVSGSGKTTLVRDCITPQFVQQYPLYSLINTGQSRTNAVTSRSTICSLLGISELIKKRLTNSKKKEISYYCPECDGSGLADDGLPCMFCDGIGINVEISFAQSQITLKDLILCPLDEVEAIWQDELKPIRLLVELGMSHLNLARRVNSLSTGEFQSVNLAQSLATLNEFTPTLLILDEPTQGLSQNVINKLIAMLIVGIEDFDLTVLAVEHNKHFIHQCPYNIDLGSRNKEPITNLICTARKVESASGSCDLPVKVLHSQLIPKSGIETISQYKEGAARFQSCKDDFLGGLLRNMSRKASWIYAEYENEFLRRPVVAFDFTKKRLYSRHTALFDLAGVGDKITKVMSADDDQFALFDYKNKRLHCQACNGSGEYSTFDYSIIIDNPRAGFWDGFIKKDIMHALRNYNFAKIKFLFSKIKAHYKIDLSAPFATMDDQSRSTLLYGKWNRSFLDPGKQTYRQWRGLLFLVKKYLKGSSNSALEVISQTQRYITCPNCNGNILRHNRPLLHNGTDIRDIRKSTLGDSVKLFPGLSSLHFLEKYLGGSVILSNDVSQMDHSHQALLKVFEIDQSSLSGFEIACKGLPLSVSPIKNIINKISQNNSVIICGQASLVSARDETIVQLNDLGFDEEVLVWQILGAKDPMNLLRKARKLFPCHGCSGKGCFSSESVDVGIDKYVEQCSLCMGSGLEQSHIGETVDDIPVECLSPLSVINAFKRFDCPESIAHLALSTPVIELDSQQFADLIGFMKISSKRKPPKRN